jgi:hypothetical protein
MQRVIKSVLAAAILLGTAATARAESVMKQCGEQWQAAKAQERRTVRPGRSF